MIKKDSYCEMTVSSLMFNNTKKSFQQTTWNQSFSTFNKEENPFTLLK